MYHPRVCSSCFNNCHFSQHQCPTCRKITRCFWQHCLRTPTHCVGESYMICRKHLATIAHFKADNLSPIPTPIRRKRQFILPPPAIVSQVTRLAQRALRYSDLETLDAAEALSKMNVE